jgi:hypothetical protein
MNVDETDDNNNNSGDDNNGTTAAASTTTVSSSRGGTLIGEKTEALHWVEKYRPNTLDELIGQGEIMHTLQRLIGGDLPHLLFYGPAGVGKTTHHFCAGQTDLWQTFQINDSMILCGV